VEKLQVIVHGFGVRLLYIVYSSFANTTKQKYLKERDTMGITSKKQKELPKEFQTVQTFSNAAQEAKAGVDIYSGEKELKAKK